jgi:hypothetical protein
MFFIFLRIGIAHIGRVGSVFITVAIAIERYVSVCKPTSDNSWKSLLIPIPVAFSIIYNVPKFFELETIDIDSVNFNKSRNTITTNEEPNTSNYTHEKAPYVTEDLNHEYAYDEYELGYRGTPLRLNHWYIVIYVFWSKFLLVEIIPWVTVIILNVCIWRKIQEFQRVRRSALRREIGTYILLTTTFQY